MQDGEDEEGEGSLGESVASAAGPPPSRAGAGKCAPI